MSFLFDRQDAPNEALIREYAGGKIPMPELYETIDSTNLRAKLLAKEGASEGKSVFALAQTAGHGRYGRPFFSGKGQGLYMSVILRPSLDYALWPQLTSYASLAVCESIEALFPSLSLQVKWVNDVYWQGKKLAGILTETVISSERQIPLAAIVGIGINLCGALPCELEKIACTLESAGAFPSYNRLAGEIIARLLKGAQEISDGSYLARYRSRCFLLSKDVLVHEGGRVYEAKAVSIADDASLCVRLTTGEERFLRAGEGSIRMQGGT